MPTPSQSFLSQRIGDSRTAPFNVFDDQDQERAALGQLFIRDALNPENRIR